MSPPSIAVGCLAGGFVWDRIAQRSTRRNNSIREPEQRFHALLPSCHRFPLGYIIFDVASANNNHWMGPCAGLFLINFALACGPNIALTYVVDGYLPWVEEGIVKINALQNFARLRDELSCYSLVDDLWMAQDVETGFWYFVCPRFDQYSHVPVGQTCPKNDSRVEVYEAIDGPFCIYTFGFGHLIWG